MGAANCCKKPDEIVIEELKYVSPDDNKINAIDQGGFPQDTEQVYRANANGEEDNGQGQIVSNQNLYEQEGTSSKIAGTYEVPINVSRPQNNYEEGNESNNVRSSQQNENQNLQSQNDEEGQYEYPENENEDPNAYEEIQEEEEVVEYDDAYANQMAAAENLNAIKMAQQSQQGNMINYNLQGQNLGGVDLKALAALPGQQALIQKQLELQQLQQAASKGNPQQGGLDINNFLQKQNEGATLIHQKNNLATVTTLSGNEDISKFFKQKNMSQIGPNELKQKEQMSEAQVNVQHFQKAVSQQIGPVDLKGLGNLDLKQVRTGIPIIDMKDLPEVFGSSDINKYKQITTTTKTEIIGNGPANSANPANSTNPAVSKLIKIEENEELPATFGSSDINNFGLKGQQTAKVTTITTTEKTGSQDRDEPKDSHNVKQTTITTTKVIGNLDMKDLPEVFGSSDINNYKKTTTTTTTKVIGNLDKKNLPDGPSDISHFKQTTTTTETTGNVDSKNKPDKTDSTDANNFKQIITTTTKEGIIDMKDLPEVFGSSDINKYKQTVTTITKEEKIDNKDSPNNNDFKQITTTVTKEEFINMKDLPEVFGSSDINKFKQTTTTITKEGIIDNKDSPNNNDFKQTTTTVTKQGIIDMKDLPEVFGSSDINNYKQTTTTTTTTKTIGSTDQSGNPENKNVEQTTTTVTKKIEKVPSSSGSDPNLKQITTTTTTKTTGNAPIDLQNQINGNEDLNKYFTHFQSQTTSEPLDLKRFGVEQNPSGAKQTTTTTTTTKIIGNVPGEINSKENGQSIGTTDLNDFNVKQTTVTKTVESTQNPQFDLKQFGIDQNQNGSSYGTTDLPGFNAQASNALDLKQFGIEGQSSANNENEDLNKYFQQTKTTTTTTNGPIDLKEFGIDMNSLSFNNGGLDNAQQKTTTTTTVTKTGNVDQMASFGGYDLDNVSGTQTTTTKVTKSSYVAPVQSQSYSYNYSFNVPATTSSTVTKTTYSNIQQ